MSEYIFGKNAIWEAVKMAVPFKKIMVISSGSKIEDIINMVRQQNPGIKIEYSDKHTVNKLSRGERTGGICAEIDDPVRYTSIDPFITGILTDHANPLILAVDSVQDPHNFGALIRSAVAAGFYGVFFPKDRQVNITGTVASSSAGACFRIPLCRVVNLARSLDQLKKHGFWIYGTAAGETTSLYSTKFNAPLVLVVGSEGKGIRLLVKKKCDQIFAIPLKNNIESLNVSVAAGIAMFEIARKIGAVGLT